MGTSWVYITGLNNINITSPCVDAGNNVLPVDVFDDDHDRNRFEELPFDIRNQLRRRDGTGNGIPIPDIGAHEVF